MNSTFGENIKRVRLSKGFNKTEMAKKLGVSDAMVHLWEKGTNEPRMGRVQDIAEKLNVSVNELIGFDTNIAYSEINTPEVEIDFYGTVSAGNFEHVPIDTGTLIAPSGVFKGRRPTDCMGMQVNGDSMNKVLANGSFIIVHDFRKNQDFKLDNNDILVVRIGNEYTVKRARRTETKLHLEPQSYSDEFLTNTFELDNIEELEVIGKVIYNFQVFN
ncbi:XRE family transcriptional regulator [Staphylococcus arlettae]|uniref:XRE family transcriptional regulator n=1 Tax=Staphylococcus arlettae TaxID=29378 RepID=UPI0021CF0F23|nr:XRE family transcriptional regulator [Staphylococcus arlettae]